MYTVFPRSDPGQQRSAVLVSAIYACADLVRARSPDGLGAPLVSGEVCPFGSRYKVSVQVSYGPAVRSYRSDEVAVLSDAQEATQHLLEATLGAVACDLARVLGGGAVTPGRDGPTP